MSTFKCKMCGGTLEVRDGSTVAECEYCGARQTLPRLDDEKRINMYDRANHFRRNNEFDKASAIYEEILNEDSTDAEAYWSLVLCRYGIEYVEDPQSHKRVPTVHRAQYTSIFDDDNYKLALENADACQRTIYEEEAKAINEIQKGILAISQKEDPFDVFICYKETDNSGKRTQDSVLAQDLYYQLEQNGFRVFFARITLEDKLGSAYEPYIFAALNSAKVMVVLGTRPEYFTAVWVKNEWSRFLAMIKAGEKKMLIPAYKDMDPYDLPAEFSHLQAQDMSKLGFMQDLVRGIRKILGEEKKTPEPVAAKAPVNSEGHDVSPMLRRAFLFLEDKKFDSADEYAEKVLDIDPECAEAYVVKLMIELGVSRPADLAQAQAPLTSSPNYQKAVRFAAPEYRKTIEGYNTAILERKETERKEMIYTMAINRLTKRPCIDRDIRQSIEDMKTIRGYKDADERIKEMNRLLEKWYTDRKKEDEEIRIRAEKERKRIEERNRLIREKTKKVLKIVIPCILVLIAALLLFLWIIPAIRYQKAGRLFDEGKYEEALAIYRKINGYADSEIQSYYLDTMEGSEVDDVDDKIRLILSYGISLKVNYKFNGGSASGMSGDASRVYNTASDFMGVSDLFRVGYWFAEWETESYRYHSGDMQGEITLSAVWSPRSYKITYSYHGGTVEKENITSYSPEDDDFTLINPTRVGYDFAGWVGTKVNTPTLDVTIPKGSYGDRTYTATWTPQGDIPYKVEHWVQNLDDDNYSIDAIDEYTGTAWSKIRPPVKTYPHHVSPTKQEVTIKPDGSLVVKYYYERKVYDLSFVTNGGTPIGKQSHKSGKAFTMPTPVREGYTFGGWFTDMDLTEPFFSLDGTVTVYAYWLEEDKPADYVYSDPGIIDGYKGQNEILRIPAYIGGTPVECIGDEAFKDQLTILQVHLPATITSIGQKAFSGCTGFTSITIPSGVTTIGASALYGCAGLTSVIIPDSVTSIGDGVFKNCEMLTSITIPFIGKSRGATGCESHFGYLFGYTTYRSKPDSGYHYYDSSNKKYYCYYIPAGLKTVVLSEGVTAIGNYAFSGCTGLTNVTIPEGVTTIGASALYGCAGLKSVSIPEGVTTIGGGAFSGCTGLTSVTIPEGVTTIGYQAFHNCTGLTSVTIPGSVTTIGYSAFEGCTGLTSVTILEGVTAIGKYAFEDCTSLKSVTIPSSVTTIGDNAFYSCTKLKAVYITDIAAWCRIAFEDEFANPLYYAHDLYLNGELLADLVIPEGVTTIGSYAFEDCTSLKSVTVPNSVITIGSYAFSGCPIETATIPTQAIGSIPKGKLQAVVINGGETIGYEAFYGCTGLTSVTIPSSVTTIGDDAFKGCTKLNAVYITDIAAWCRIAFEDEFANPLYYADNLYLNGELVTGLTIPEGVTTIGSYAFYGCTGFTSVAIPSSVTTIGSCAFSGCTGFTSVAIPSSVTTIGASAFSGCTGFRSITIPFIGASRDATGYKSHFGYLFGCITYSSAPSSGYHYYDSSNKEYYCYYIPAGLKTVVLSEGVTYIGGFRGCTGLTSVAIPSSVTSIGGYAFYGCTGLTSVTIPEGVTTIGASAFSGCTGLKSVSIPEGVTTIGGGAFSGCTGLTSVTIPEGVTTIGYQAFHNCIGLTSVIIPNSVTTIGDYAFYKCTGLTSVTIPEGVTAIGSSAFYGCTGLTSVTIPNSVTSIGERAFQGCKMLTSITIPFIGKSRDATGYKSHFGYLFGYTTYWSEPSSGYHYYDSSNKEYYCYYIPAGLKTVVLSEGVTAIGNYAFSGCTGLTSVTIPGSVTTIGESAFCGCAGLTSVTIPSSVTIIGQEAFRGCAGFTSITIPSGVTTIGASAFSGCTGLTSVTIPEGVTAIGSSAFYGCTGLTSVTIPNSVTSIGERAFQGCKMLTSITIPFIGKSRDATGYESHFGYLFGYTTYRSEPDSGYHYYSSGVYYCYNIPTGLKTVVLSESVTAIDYRAFYNCTDITSVTIPSSVTTIGSEAFRYCTSLETIHYGGTTAQWKAIQKGNYWNYSTGSFTVICTDGTI